jgi:hypothetical protein
LHITSLPLYSTGSPIRNGVPSRSLSGKAVKCHAKIGSCFMVAFLRIGSQQHDAQGEQAESQAGNEFHRSRSLACVIDWNQSTTALKNKASCFPEHSANALVALVTSPFQWHT